MKAVFSISKDDYLALLLFDHTKSKEKRRNLISLWIQIMILWILILFFFYFSNHPLLTFFSFLFGIYYSLFFPFRQPRAYKTFYENYINKVWVHRQEKECLIEIFEETITMVEDTVEFKISTSEVFKIIELQKYFFVYCKFGGTLILPKESFASCNLIEELSKISTKNSISIESELNWKWSITSLIFPNTSLVNQN